MKNITSFLCGGILLLLFQGQSTAAPLGLDWFTNLGTGTGVFKEGGFTVDGVQYIGTTLGAENSDFYQRYVVRVGGGGAGPSPNFDGFSSPASHSGGVPGGPGGNAACATIAPGSSSVCVVDSGLGSAGNQGLGFDPLGLFSASAGGRITVEDSGNGTNDPTTAVVYMVVKDSTFQQEFLKDSLNNKPKITATLTTSEMISTVSMDMRAIDYNTLNANTPFVNTLSFTNPADGSGNFNHATDAQEANVTAGQFVYLPQGGWSGYPTSGFKAGIYLQADGGGFNMFDNDVYGFYYDPDQNGGVVIPHANGAALPAAWSACAAAGTCVLPAFARD